MEPLVSVIVPTKDRAEQLAAALESVAAQTLCDPGSGHRVEVVVVNDGGASVEDVVEKAGLDEVKLVESPGSHGHATARNTGIEAADGRYLAFLDDDDLYLPEHLETAVAALREADLVYAFCRTSDHRVQPGEEPLHAKAFFDVEFDAGLLLVGNYIPTSAIVCRNDRAARFDPSIPVLVDWELLLRLVHGHGWRAAATGRPTVVYHRIADQRSDTVDSTQIVAGHDRYRQGYPALLDRWPVAKGSPIEVLREHMTTFNDECHERLVRGEPLPHLLYEQAFQVLHAAYTGRITPADVPARLTATLT
ncbi:glycosyltransferase family 2 protein [Allokutzneria sp. A3M-2-11 16]|uniref:glycosyltransferase family 2 protein n=1 Tax=Allokutzneria sp. A3M-2-11 16 TaxID=2962043 RepID=UPI0020B672F4|nr:glycosyltransferase family 2 protein [Allokutzneria sp. A3M-2-11 16]MCP3803733.1 glycosyltransferase family 2 protein [Allokutzneria sp. A3M-2-11 16]